MQQTEYTVQTHQKNLKQQERRYFRAIITMAILYAIQFIILPLLLDTYFPGSSNEATAIFWASSCIVMIIGFWFVSQRLMSWFIADAIYLGLILLYSAEGAYGIGLRGITLDNMHTYFDRISVIFGALICLVEILIVQLSLKGIYCAANHLRHKSLK